MTRLTGILITAALSAATLTSVDGAPLRQQGNQGNQPGYAASSVDKGAQCREQVGRTTPRRPLEANDTSLQQFDACMSNGGGETRR